MNLESLKSKKKNVLIYSAILVLTCIVGFYAGRYYERNTFAKFRSEMRRSGTRDGSGMMRNFDQRMPY